MRSVMTMVLSATVLLLGGYAMSEQAQQVKPTLNTTAQNNSYNVSITVYEGVTNSGGQSIVWFAAIGVILLSMGMLVMASRGGR